MKKFLLSCMLCMMVVVGICQDGNTHTQPAKKDNKVVRRIKVRSADPQLIALLLAGKIKFTTPPEISTVENTKK